MGNILCYTEHYLQQGKSVWVYADWDTKETLRCTLERKTEDMYGYTIDYNYCNSSLWQNWFSQ